MKTLTAKQAAVLDVVRRLTMPRGPSLRELSKEMGFATHTGPLCHLNALIKKGYVKRLPLPDGYGGCYVARDGIATIWGIVHGDSN
ncbi:MAG: hypothetical protein U0744_02525 [Gemmataceae bacterium]